METLRVLLLICHFAALATQLGACVYHLVTRRPPSGVLVGGAFGLLVTGVLLAVTAMAAAEPINGPKLGVKLVIAAAVLSCAIAARRRQGVRLVAACGLLAVANAAIAVLWA
ncbi:hypothetical protein [Nonomuraea jabiensis]|uniref:hypothetical protein n=1 Tax=Nonomuraea jabiensis TaxID=882448 RepID=UPI00369E7115